MSWKVVAEHAAGQAAFPLSRFLVSGFALHPADCARLLQLLADAELALLLRALDLFHAPGDHIEEEPEIDHAMYGIARVAYEYSGLG